MVSSPVKHYISQKSGYNFTNSFKPNFTKVMGHKIWEDDNDAEGLRPKNIAVGLLKNGQIIGKKLVTNYKNWHYEFDQLEQLDDQGRLIQYQIIEDSVANYEKQVQGYDLKNTLLPSQTKIQGTKVWRDDDNKDQTRPKKIVVELIKDGTVLATQTVDAKSGWNYEFKNIPKYQHGRKIQYQVREQSVKYYQTSYEGDQIIGTLMGEIQITGRHSWKDQENKARVRPEKIVVYLTQNGKETQTRIIDANNDWHYIFENLPKYDQNGKKYLYNVSVQKVPQYVTHSDGYDFMGSLKPRFIFKEKKDKTKFDKVKPENQKPVVSKVEESKVKVVDVVTPKQAVVETTKQQSGAENTDKNDMTEDKTETSVKEKTPVDFKNKTSESTKVKSEAPKQETLKVEEPKVKVADPKTSKSGVVETTKNQSSVENVATETEVETAVKVETPVDLKNAKAEPIQVKSGALNLEASKTAVPKVEEPEVKTVDSKIPKSEVIETVKQEPVAETVDKSTTTETEVETAVKVETPVDLKNAKAEPTQVNPEALNPEASKTAVPKIEEPEVKTVDPKISKPGIFETTKNQPSTENVATETEVETAVKVETSVDLKNKTSESDQAKVDVNKKAAPKPVVPKIEKSEAKTVDPKTLKSEVVETIKEESVAETVDKSTTNESKLETEVKVETPVDLKNEALESDQAKVDVNQTEVPKPVVSKVVKLEVKAAYPMIPKPEVVETIKQQPATERVEESVLPVEFGASKMVKRAFNLDQSLVGISKKTLSMPLAIDRVNQRNIYSLTSINSIKPHKMYPSIHQITSQQLLAKCQSNLAISLPQTHADKRSKVCLNLLILSLGSMLYWYFRKC